MKAYDHKKIEKKWQQFWAKHKIYSTPDKAVGKDNFFLLVEFPYPSGNLHVGHWYAFAIPDILARTKRMQGKNVLYPIGFDAFGLPAENAAIQRGINPRTWTKQNIAYMSKQVRSMGTSFDWSREVQTIDPAYYKWTQWMFLQFFKKGLAYQKETAVNWCPKDKTVLANEQVVEGKCERCGSEVVQRQMLQWNLKITEYADRLVDDLDALDWPEPIKDAQRAWIGRSEGAEIDFPLVFENDKKYKFVFLHGWKSTGEGPRYKWMIEELEKLGHTVLIPKLPNTEHPKEIEQVEAALNATEYDENTILVGHSLGGLVALKVAERLKKPIARLIVVSAAMNPSYPGYEERPFKKDFSWKIDAEKIKEIAPVRVVLSDLQEVNRVQYLKDLAQEIDARLVETKAIKPHFKGDKEPDILMWLRPTIRVFTTRADTLYGGTFLVLAPEHPWVTLAIQKHRELFGNAEEIERYIALSAKKTELERQESRDKTGVELKGVKAINPASGKEIPLWIGDFAIATFGTGALFGDAHDERDVEFATKYGIPLKETLQPLVFRTSGADAVKGEPFKDREAVMALVRRKSDGKFLAINYRPTSTHEFVSGGLEAGETHEQAAVREIREETGYTNVKFVRSLGSVIHTKYYSVNYKQNIFGHYQPLLFELLGDERVEVSADEKARHEVLWLTEEEMSGFLNRDDYRSGWNRYVGKPYTGYGVLYDSAEFSGLTSEEALPKIGAKFGRLVKQYRLRDWIVSRQRYWGVPIPIVHCPKCGAVPVPDKDLPVKLPDVKDYLPEGSGKSPLAKVGKFVNVKCPKCKGKAERETDTLDTFVDSSWYFLRYTDPRNSKEFAANSRQKKWMPINLYSGGAEHTTMHVLYSRFWHKALYDLGLVADKEPYTRRMNRSIILGPDGQKMSKSRGNVIDPDEVVARLGADTVRLYLAFIGPYNEVGSYPWNPDGVVGVRRFLERLWRTQEYVVKGDVAGLETVLHRTIRKVGDDIALLKFNTAIAQLMVLQNAIEKEKKIGKRQWDSLLKLVAPFAPHIAEELWSLSKHKGSIHKADWPAYDEAKIKTDTVKLAVQINGKTRAETEVAADSDKATQEEAAKAAVAERLAGKAILRTIVVQNRLVNFVVAE
jgi:leucyl-tRNA synthetase/predicted esterase YcpF (UPF0227 family)